MAAGRLLNLDSGKMLHALGSAGTQAGGLWEFLRDAADALLQVCIEQDIRHQEIESIRVFVYQDAKDVSGKVDVPDPVNSELREKVSMIVDDRIDSAYPDKWGSRVEVKMKSGALFTAFTDCPRGDPENMLSQRELEQKVLRLAEFSGRADADSIRRIIAETWNLSVLESFASEFH